MTTPAGGPTRRQVLQLGGVGLASLVAGCTRSPQRALVPALPGPTSARPAQAGVRGAARPGFPALSTQLSSPLLLPGAAGYALAARLYNPRFDPGSHPAAIARCASARDVAACVRFAAAGGAPIRLRAGGHSYGGWSSGPGLVADVRRMAGVAVDTASRTARVGAGALLVDVYAALAAKGMALAAGSCPTVGITGLTLGGGVGVLTRAFGLTCDAVRSIQLVTADGVVREVGPRTGPELFWALRGGGGGSFGAVTAFTFAVRPAPTVTTFFLEWSFDHAEAVLAAWQRWTAGADKRLWSTCKLLATPARGGLRAVVAGTWIGPSSGLQQQLQPLLTAVGAPPRSRNAHVLGYGQAMLLEAGCRGQSAAQCTAQALSPARRQPFAATSAILAGPLPSAGVHAAVAGVRAGLGVPGMVEGGVSFDALGGAVAAIAPGDTAFVHRRALATVQYTATWDGSRAPARFDAFVRGQRLALRRWTGSSAYVNYADPSIADSGTAYWGGNLARLRAVKRRYDPGGLFTFPQSVHP